MRINVINMRKTNPPKTSKKKNLSDLFIPALLKKEPIEKCITGMRKPQNRELNRERLMEEASLKRRRIIAAITNGNTEKRNELFFFIFFFFLFNNVY